MNSTELKSIVRQLKAKIEVEKQVETKLYASLKNKPPTDEWFRLVAALNECQSNQYILKSQIQHLKQYRTYGGKEIKITTVPKRF
jgi:phage anti-repressor protein